MSDSVISQIKPFRIEISKTDRSTCKKCKQKCPQGELKVAKIISNPVGPGKLRSWYHKSCIFDVFSKQKPTTRRIESCSRDVDGWEALNNDIKTDFMILIEKNNRAYKDKFKKIEKKSKKLDLDEAAELQLKSVENCNSFFEFRKVVADVRSANSCREKIKILRNVFGKGADGDIDGFKQDAYLWCKLLLPGVPGVVKSGSRTGCCLNNNQLLLIFSQLFSIDEEKIRSYLEIEQSDLGQTIQYFFEHNLVLLPAKKSTLTLQEVDDFLEKTYNLPEKVMPQLFEEFTKKCTANEIRVLVRLIKHDLRMKAGAKHVFEALYPGAYDLFKTTKDVKAVLKNWGKKRKLSPQTSPSRRVNKKVLENVKSPPKEKNVNAIMPNYFHGVKLLVEDGVDEVHGAWIQWFNVYGGSVLSSEDCLKATHVLHLKDSVSSVEDIECGKSARHVIVEWIKDSVMKESLQDFRPYSVRWNPNC